MRVLITEKIAEEGVELLREYAEVDVKLGLSKSQLLDIIQNYEAIIVRSATEVDEEVILKGTLLKVIGHIISYQAITSIIQKGIFS